MNLGRLLEHFKILDDDDDDGGGDDDDDENDDDDDYGNDTDNGLVVIMIKMVELVLMTMVVRNDKVYRSRMLWFLNVKKEEVTEYILVNTSEDNWAECEINM